MRVPGRKEYPGYETLHILPPQQNIFSYLPLLLTTREGLAEWADQLLLRASTEHILIVRGLRARKLAARLAFLTATPTRHILSHSNTAPPHRRTEGPDQVVYRRHPLTR